MEAKVRARDLPISTKETIEVSDFIRYRNLNKAVNLLNEVLEHKKAVPYKRFNRDRGHKAGMMSGAYPQKTIKSILIVLNSVKKNAENKGMNANDLIINYMVASKGPTQWHYGRMKRRRMKSTHLEVRVTEKNLSEKSIKKKDDNKEEKK